MKTYSGSRRPGIFALKVDPAIDVRDRQELGDLVVCHDFGLRASQDSHGNRVCNQAFDLPFRKAGFLSNIVEGDLATGRDHVRDMVSADCVNADEIGDLTTLAHEMPSWTSKPYRGEFEDQHQGLQEQLV